MSDLIDRQRAIEAICMETCGVSLRNERCMVHCTEVQAVEKLPPAQPEIIRCKDCKYRGVGDYCVYGTRLAWVTKSNDFCSKAERRTDE